MNNQDTRPLDSATHAYWECAGNIDERLKNYISEKQPKLGDISLLQAELDYARALGNLSAKTCHTLVMLVGFSLEPLLQSVCAYQPQKVVLLLNQRGYGQESADEFFEHVQEAINRLEVVKPEICHFSTPDSPEGVFKTLTENLRNKTDVVIDITGGKKSMVSGAFMYAAYSNTTISYVDFGTYDIRTRRPYGYSCKIGELKNPYDKFALRQWERVQALYKNYQFREALKIVGELKETMKEVFSDAQKPIEQLIAFLEYYAVWDSGNYQGANELAKSLGEFTQPTAVTALGNNWPNRTHFYADQNLHVYVCDELARIERLITMNEDCRSAFLRAGGLNEIVMVARLVSNVNESSEQNALLDSLDKDTPGIYSIFKQLLQTNTVCVYEDKNGNVRFGNQKTFLATLRIDQPMQKWWIITSQFNSESDGWEKFLNKRNDLAHKYFSVTRDLAEDALAFVTANIEDFYGQSVTNLGVHTSAMPWRELCEKTGLSQFLPPNLRQEAQT